MNYSGGQRSILKQGIRGDGDDDTRNVSWYRTERERVVCVSTLQIGCRRNMGLKGFCFALQARDTYNYKYGAVQAENLWGKAVGRIVIDGWSVQKAVDELINRMKKLLE